MALTPIPYTDNWFDTFGSQEAPPAQAAKTAPIVIATAASLAGQVLTINRTHALPMQVIWGDGVTEVAASGAKTHTYTRRGVYRVRSFLTSFPDVYKDEIVFVTTEPGAGPFSVDPQTAPEPEPSYSPPYPWANFATHQAINDWVDAEDLTVVPAWFQWTIQVKKDWLESTYGE